MAKPCTKGASAWLSRERSERCCLALLYTLLNLLNVFNVNFSSELPLEWTLSTSEMIVVDAVPFLADAVLENVDELSGNIALVGRDTDESQSRTGRKVTYPEKVERAFEAGAVRVIVVNTPRGGKDGDDSSRMGSDTGNYKSTIPVLIIKSSDAARLRKRGCALIRDKGAPVVV